MIKFSQGILSLFLAVVLSLPVPSLATELRKVDEEPSQALLRLSSGTLALQPLPQLPQRFNATGVSTAGLFRKPVAGMRLPMKRTVRHAPISKILSSTVEVCGQMVYKAGGTGDERGFYRLPHSAREQFELLGKTAYNIEYGGYFDPEAYTYTGATATTQNGGQLASVSIVSYDASTWEVKSFNTLADLNEGIKMLATAVARDPSTGNVYGFFYDETGQNVVWAKADYENATRTPLGGPISLSQAPAAIACTADGLFYGIDLNGSLVYIDTETGEIDEMADTDLPIEYGFGVCINDKDGTMLATSNTEDYSSGLYEIDLDWGTTTKLADFNADIQILNLFVMPGATSEKAPAEPLLSLQNNGGSLTVDYTLTLPELLADGTAATGVMDWSISGETELAHGSGTPGSVHTGSFTVSKPGVSSFTATASNNAGTSAKSRVSLFVGKDAPASPTNVVLTYADGKMLLEWDAVTSSQSGGYVDKAAITYTVYRAGDVKASGLKVPRWEETVAEPEERTVYQYSVAAVYEDKASAAVLSNELGLGSFSAPFETLFNSTETFDKYGYVVEDVNKDRKTWTPTSKGARYQFNKDKDADDWLFTPSVKVEAGKVYELTLKVYVNSANSPETFEVKAGRNAVAAAMTTEVLSSTTINAVAASPVEVKGYFSPEETGSFHIGIHAISPANMWYLFVQELRLSGALQSETPSPVSNFKVVPDPAGKLEAVLEFDAPSMTVSAKPLEGSFNVEIFRDGKRLESIAVEAGKHYRHVDRPETAGSYKYTAAAVYKSVKGADVSVDAFVGPYSAKAPSEVIIREGQSEGTVDVEWTAVTEDIAGNVLPAANITYMVYGAGADGKTVAMLDAPTTDTKATVMVLSGSETQSFVYYGVTAFNLDAQSELTASNMIAVGKAYEMPVKYTNAQSTKTHILGIDKSGGASWTYMADEDGVPSADGDGQYYACNTYSTNRYADLITGKIHIAPGSHAELSFFTYRFTSGDKNVIEVYTICGGVQKLLATISHADQMENRWNSVHVLLDEYAGKDIQIVIRSIHATNAYTLVDCIRIAGAAEKELEMLSVAAPSTALPEKKYEVSVRIVNNAYLDASGAEVVLVRDGVDKARKTVNVAAGDIATVVFDDAISFFDSSVEAVYGAKVIFDGDAVPENNAGGSAKVVRKVSKLPVVEDLEGEAKNDGNHLTWSAFDQSLGEPAEKTEDFEDGDSFSHSFGQWTFVDNDECAVGGIQGVDIPGIEHGKTLASFFVFDVSSGDFSDNFAARGGDKYLASLYETSGYGVDDWAVSPRLSGKAQTISFYARSLSSEYPESIEIWYSEVESDDFFDYTQDDVFGTKDVPKEWTCYTAGLPEGTRYFAIRSCSEKGLMLMVDDVTYTPDPANEMLSLAGYNVYRDGVLLTQTPVTTNSFVDAQPASGQHTYHVTHVFDRGESELSNAVTVGKSGLDAVEGAVAVVRSVDGCIVVSNSSDADVAVFGVDGSLLYRCAGDMRKAFAPGVYLVSVGSRTFKIANR